MREEDKNKNEEVEIIEELEGENSLNPSHNDVNDVEKIYPNANIKVERGQFSVFELKRKYEKEQIIMNPDFQRNETWEKKQKYELIESILMGIPLPLIYLTENREGKLIIIDGRQRLTTLFEFLDNKFKLNKLRILHKLNDSYFKDLEPKLQANLEDYQLISHIIKPPTPDRIKFDIFDRVNRGGTPLNNQEMRNAIYQGESTKLLKKLSELEIFKKATGNSINAKKMKDRYLILRFLSFYLLKKEKLLVEYKSDIDDFLGKSMEYINSLNENELKKLKTVFITAMTNSYEILGKDAFRLPNEDPNRNRPVNMYFFESVSFLLCNKDFMNLSEKIKSIYKDLINNKEYLDTLTYTMDSSISVMKRFEIIDKAIEELENAK